MRENRNDQTGEAFLGFLFLGSPLLVWFINIAMTYVQNLFLSWGVLEWVVGSFIENGILYTWQILQFSATASGIQIAMYYLFCVVGVLLSVFVFVMVIAFILSLIIKLEENWDKIVDGTKNIWNKVKSFGKKPEVVTE